MSFLVVLEFPAPMNKWQLIVFSMLQVWANKPKFRFLMTAKLLLDDFFGRNATVQYCRPFVLRDVMKIQIHGIRNPKIGRRGVDDKSSFCTLLYDDWTCLATKLIESHFKIHCVSHHDCKSCSLDNMVHSFLICENEVLYFVF